MQVLFLNDVLQVIPPLIRYSICQFASVKFSIANYDFQKKITTENSFDKQFSYLKIKKDTEQENCVIIFNAAKK